MAQTIRLEIPNYLPPRELNPNARVHWRVRYEAQQELKSHVIAACSQQSIWPYILKLTTNIESYPWGKVKVQLIFFVPDNRRRDRDNYIAGMKAGLDALQDRIIQDDKDIVTIGAEFVKDKALAPMTVIEVNEIE